MHKRSAVLTALLAGGSVLAALPSAAPAAKPKAVKVAYITYVYFDYQKVEERGIKNAVAPGGGSVRVFNANFDPQKMQQQCADAVQSKRYNAIVLAPVDSNSAIPCVRVAKSAGIPVVTIENPAGKNPNAVKPQLPGVVGSIVTTPGQAGANYAKLVKLACAGKATCKVIAEESPGDPFSTAWVSAASKLSNVKVVQKINTQYDPSKTAQLLPDALARTKDADVFMGSQDENALAAISIVKAAGVKNLKILGTGGSRRAAAAIGAGTMFGTLGSWPLQTGAAAGKMLIKSVNGQRIAKPGVNGVTMDKPGIVIKSNVKQFKPEWGAK